MQACYIPVTVVGRASVDAIMVYCVLKNCNICYWLCNGQLFCLKINPLNPIQALL